MKEWVRKYPYSFFETAGLINEHGYEWCCVLDDAEIYFMYGPEGKLVLPATHVDKFRLLFPGLEFEINV